MLPTRSRNKSCEIISTKDFAILYRTNAQSRAFEESLRRMGIALYHIWRHQFLPAKGDKRPGRLSCGYIVNPKDEEA